MSKVHTRNLIVLFLILVCFACAVFVTGTGSPRTAHAAATPRYAVTFDYTHYYQYNTSKTVNGEGNNVTVTPSISFSQFGKTTVSIALYGSGAVGSGVLANGGAINSSIVNIEMTSNFATNSGSVKNSAGTTVGTITNKKGFITGLSDGLYNVSISSSSPGWNPNPRAYAAYSLACRFSFRVDTKSPAGTLYGGTNIIANGGKTNANYVKFVATDSGSGVKAVYVKKPGKTNYETYINGSQLAEEGTFSFYCVDEANNQSAVYTVTRDSSAPTLTCAESNFYSTINKGFTVNASDSSGTVKLYYKTPSMSSFKLNDNNSYTVSGTAQDGKYYFYAEDAIGNRSNEVWIELRIAAPEATIVRSETDNSVYATWSDNSTAKLNGQPYTKGTWIRTEGSYTLVLQNSAGRTATYTFEVGHSYKAVRTVAPTCTTQGYTVYECISCSDSYNADFVNPKGHDYEESTIDATCTERGAVRHTCKNCGDYYDTDGEPAKGHSYVEETVAATCTTSGYLKHTCTVCGFEYQSDVVSPSGHQYSSTVVKQGSCTENGLRTHRCAICGDTYSTEIPALGHQYEITDVETNEGTTIRTYTCTVCGDSYTQNLGNQYEKVTSYIEYLFNLYSPYMLWVFLATAGVWSIVLGIMIIIAHKNEDKEKARRMIVNYVIGLVVIFCILVACPYLIRGIAALIA